MSITHIVVIVDDEEGIHTLVNNLASIKGFEGSALIVTDTIQSAINLLSVS